MTTTKEKPAVTWSKGVPSIVTWYNGEIYPLYNLYQLSKVSKIPYSTIYSWVQKTDDPLWVVSAGTRKYSAVEIINDYVQNRKT